MNDPYSRLRPPALPPADEVCKCAGGKPIKLMAALGENPLHCVDCNLEVPLESIPLTVKLVDDIADWRAVYDALDRLWLDSREYEDWATKELADIASAANKRGMLVCQKLNALRRCYYWYFQDQSVDGFEPVALCPNCRRKFTLYAGGIFRQFVCEGCSIITAGQ